MTDPAEPFDFLVKLAIGLILFVIMLTLMDIRADLHAMRHAGVTISTSEMAVRK